MQEETFMHAAHVFIKAGRLHRAYCDRLVAKVGLHRNQHMILMQLACEKSKPSQKELAARLEISPAAVAVILKKLEQDGFIHRCSAKDDSRFNETTITQKGRDAVEKTRSFFAEVDKALFCGLSAEELTHLETSLNKMCDNLCQAIKKEESN